MCRLAACTVAVLFLLSAAVSHAHPGKGHGKGRGKIPKPLDVIQLPNGYKPEGVAAGWGDNVYVGSLLGKVSRVNVRTGITKEILSIPDDLKGGLTARLLTGLKVSFHTNVLFVAGALTGRAYIATLNPHTGDVTPGTFTSIVLNTTSLTYINDVSLRHSVRKGKVSVTAYFTDSFAGKVYQVSGTPGNFKLTATYSHLAFETAAGTFGLNGLIADPLPRNTLLLAHTSKRQLLKVTISKKGTVLVKNVTVVDANKKDYPLAVDGLLPGKRPIVYASENTNSTVTELRFSSDFTSARVKKQDKRAILDNPATIAQAAGYLYVTNTHFNDADPATRCPGGELCPDKKFELIKVKLA